MKGWQRSLTFRLGLIYGGVALVTLLAVAAVLYWAVVDGVRRDDQRFLSEKIHVLRTMLKERPNDHALLSEEVEWETGVLGHARYYVEITRPGGQATSQTPGFARSGIDSARFPTPAGTESDSAPMAWQTTASGRTYLLSSAFGALGGQASARRVIHVALDVSHEKLIFQEFRRIAWAVVGLGMLLSTVLAAVVARRALNPLAAMARAAAETSASRLDERLDLRYWPAELLPLVREFNGMLHRLDLAFSRISAFSADLAHELRTPLNNVMGEAEVMLSRSRTSAEYRETLGSILEECQQLSRMAENLLFLARSENPSAMVRREHFAAAQEVEKVVDYYDAVAEEAGLRLSVSGDCMVNADRELLRRAVTNLLSNAIRHSPRGGEVSIRLWGGTGEDSEIAVNDSGEGIQAELQPRLFERFFRGPCRRRTGAGLGLAIVKSIMDLHGGRISMVSEVGRGTRVRLSFPESGQGGKEGGAVGPRKG